MTILVSIVSEQTLPNYLFIKEFQNKVDKFLFVSTEQMEQKSKTETICNVAHISKERRIKVIASDNLLYEVHERLKKINLNNENCYLINLTGGTKILSIAIWNFFRQFSNVRYFYVPVNVNSYIEIFIDRPSLINEFTYKMSVEEYLKIHHMNYNVGQTIYPKNLVYEFYNEFKSYNFKADLISKKILKILVASYSENQLIAKWFEEYIYHRVLDSLNLNTNQIITGLMLFDYTREQIDGSFPNDNELDVFFIYDNRPFILECKLSLGKDKINIQTVNQTIYKLSSINKRFGITVKSTIFTLSDFDSLNNNSLINLKHRCKLTGVYFPFFDVNKIKSEKFIAYLTEFLN